MVIAALGLEQPGGGRALVGGVTSGAGAHVLVPNPLWGS
jgi:hypothetical protein